MQGTKELMILSPFEMPDQSLALATIDAGAFPILHLGRDEKKAEQALESLSKKTEKEFGVCFTNNTPSKLKLPKNVSRIIVPFGFKLIANKKTTVFCQVHSIAETQSAIEQGYKSIIIKGNEGAGKVAYKSSFVLFQQIMSKYADTKTDIYIQGGVGIHTTAAALALGAKGVILDNQVALFPECSAPKEIKDLAKKLSGSETTVIDNFRILLRKNSPPLPPNAQYKDILPYLQGFDLSANILPMGQDISLSVDLVDQYKKLGALVSAFHEAAYGHLLQAKTLKTISPQNDLAKDLGIQYPIAQGPMARVSDVPEFANKIAETGALPFLAMSMSVGKAAQNLVMDTKKLVGEKTWGVGILGFIPQSLRDEQTKYILEAKPSVVLIAGGRPSLAKPFEKEGIKTFLHVPSAALLEMFMKEGVRNFIFEGRESGGHVGPLSSLVLWEKQIFKLLKDEKPSTLRIFFAGGIHDAFSSAFISIMSATLAAKGAKIGVLMGTSYLYTQEAVETGAILEEYQRQSIEQNETVLLEAAPGQETRSLKSPFTEFFKKEKKRLYDSKMDSKEAWIRLEEMNIGRLRIAAKGIERKENELVKLNTKDQFKNGLYMIGQVAAMRSETITMSELHKDVAEDNNKIISKLEDIAEPISTAKPLDIAIVGMACIYPDAKNLEEYWKNILLGKDCITEVPDSRWNKDLFYKPDTRDTDYVVSKWGGFIPTVNFDPLEFGITPQSLASIEPTQLLSLLVAKRALDDAGYKNLEELDRENTSVIFGAEGATELAGAYGLRAGAKQAFGELPEHVKNALPRLNEDSFAGILSNVISGRIANRLNLGGRNYTVDAACASSLAALDLGCQELSSDRSDMVLLGGADLHNGINDFLMFSSTYALSKKGYCASFDAGSDGIALGEGIAVLVLKRLEDAERDGNKIYSVIKGIGGSSDGKSLGMTAPNRKGQTKALERAYQAAGILPSKVGLIEAHGTGTVVGDKTELAALTDMFLASGAVVGQTHLGSVKTQIGHAKCAAGIAGVVKSALSIYYGVKPPTIHLDNPNSAYNKETSPFVFNTEAGLWSDEKRIAGVSAFGFGGTNFHVIMENHNAPVSFASALPTWPSELFVFRGDNRAEAKQLAQKIKDLLLINDELKIKDIAYTLATYNKKDIQISVVAKDQPDLLSKVEAILADKAEASIYLRDKKDGKVAFLFSGQGSQRVNMARELFVAFPAMRRLLEQNKEYEKIIFPEAVFDDATRKAQQVAITDTRNAQPLLGVVDLAIAEFFRSLGIEPDMVAGHSYGEIPALCFAGAFAAENLIPLSRNRAESILNAVKDDKGKMLAVSIPETELNPLLKGEKEVWAVNFNSQKQIVLAGSTPGMTAFMEKLTKKNIAYRELNVACAFHSPLLNDAKDLYAKVLSKVNFGKLTLPVWSNTTAELYPTKDKEIKGRLSEHLIKPVLFTKQVENMYADGARIFIETGPGRVLTGLIQTILGTEVTAIQSEDKSTESIGFILHSIAKYLATGKDVNVEKLFDQRGATQLNIEEIDQYKKRVTVWHINGHNAVPSVGKMPSHGAMPLTQPLMDLNNVGASANGFSTTQSGADHIVLEYLNSMKMMIQNQRDVMLGYFGQTVEPSRIEVVQSPTVISSTPTQQAATQIATQVAVAPTMSVSVEEIKVMLLEVVSEKTGYPVEMLGLDMDMEADLSIDSIKRMEIIGALRDRLNITGGIEESEDAIEKMASIKTLNGMIEWIDELAKANLSAMPTHEVQTTTTTLQTTDTAATPAVTVAEIKAILLDTVSEKTGYPVDMLGLDMDMEADLSIDSIKRMEIIGALRDKLNLTGGIEESEDAIEKMASIKTLNGIIGWIEEIVNENQSTVVPQPEGQPAMTIQPAPAAPKKRMSFDINSMLNEDAIAEATKEGGLSQMCFALEDWPCQSPTDQSIVGKKIAITDDGGTNSYAKEIKKLLKAQGAEVDIVSKQDNFENYDGLLVFNISEAPIHYTIEDVFCMIKKADTDRLKWIYTFSDLLASLDAKDSVANLKDIQGFPGLIKSLAREYTDINCRAIVFHTLFNRKTLPQIVLNELSVSDISAEIIYDKDQRLHYNLRPEILSVTKKSEFKLDKESVIVVLGGAQGITAELVSQLSTEYPCHYILIGRSGKPSSENEKYRAFKTKNDIRQYLIKEEKMNVPAEIEKKVQSLFKENQIVETLNRIKKSGSKVTYKSLDVTNEKALRQYIRDIYKKFGKIDGFIHAAGLLEDKLFAQKTLESFLKVYSTKVKPLHVVLEELRPDIKLFVMFSSVASAYGNKGQTDYAAANSVFDLTASTLSKKSKARVLTINWGPWKGAGMVSDSLEKEFNKRGVSLIPLIEGGNYFVEEIKYGKENQVLVMGGGNDITNFIELN